MPTFENGWICRECWCANREEDERCYRCHAVPMLREMPKAITFSTPDGKPNEERTRVSSLTAAVARPVEAAAPATREPAAPAQPRQLAILVGIRAIATTIARSVRQLVRLARAVPGAPRAAGRFAAARVQAAFDRVTSPVRRVLSHRRSWLTVAWMVSAFSCALLFSAALKAPVTASLLVVASVAIFSGLTTALAMNASERQVRSADDSRGRPQVLDDARDRGPVASAEHPAQPGEILGSRGAR